MDVSIFLSRPEAKIPEIKTSGSAGADIYAAVNQMVTIPPGETVMIPTGIKTKFDSRYVALIYARSGLASKQGLAPANKVCVIDSDYRGEWMIPLHNHSKQPRIVDKGDRIAQVIFHEVFKPEFIPCNEEDLGETERGEGGFGSTNKK